MNDGRYPGIDWERYKSGSYQNGDFPLRAVMANDVTIHAADRLGLTSTAVTACGREFPMGISSPLFDKLVGREEVVDCKECEARLGAIK